MMILVLLLLLVTLPTILMILLFLVQKTTKKAKTLVPPGPPGLPLIGNLHQLGTASNTHVYLSNLSKKYGPLMQLKLGSAPLLVISSAKLAKHVLKAQDLVFCSRPNLIGPRKLSYNNSDMVFAPYNAYWRDLRRITAVHLFSLAKVQSFRPVREDEVARMIARVSSLRSSSDNGVVNLNKIQMALAGTLICRIAFGRRYDEQGVEMRRFEELLHEAQAMMATFFVSDYFPSFGWVDRLTGLIDRLDKAFKNLDSFYQELIDEHLTRKEEKEEEEHILGELIKIKQDKSSSSMDLDWDHIKALLMNIFVGATDTTTASIVWTMTALMKAPNVMKKLQSEIRNLIGKKGKVDEDDLPKLPYLKAVICETMRLYPAAPLLVPRETTEPCTLEGYKIEPKTIVYVNAWAVARDPEYWVNPDEFLPERFLSNNIDVKGQDFGVIPFGSGRRICPGMLMGLANVELTVANLVYSFDWKLPPGVEARDVDTDVLTGLTMHKKNPLLLVPMKYVM